MDFSVVLCTYNRAANLPACIGALAAQEGEECIDWEVLVVDNNSSDDTAATVEHLQAEHPIRLRYAFEPKQGLSNARNCGIRESAGTHVIFIDDDILATPRWLRSYAQTFAEHDCDAAGGRILVESPARLPAWIRPEMMGFLGQQDFGDEPCELDGVDRYPFGGNMAFHRRALARVGDFDPNLGRKGTGASADELFKGEETAYFRALVAGGGRIRYAPGAEVTHRILPYQLKRRFFLTIHYNEGYQAARRAPPAEGRTLLGAPFYLYSQTLRAFGRYLGHTLRRGPNASMRQLMTLAYFVGRLRCQMDHRREAGGA
jgi:glycosyltransferase involved in cell wall biosynthesis